MRMWSHGTSICRFGIFPSWGLSQKLSRIIGPNKAREVSLTASPLTAEVAEKLGLVNHVVEEGEVLNQLNEGDQIFLFDWEGYIHKDGHIRSTGSPTDKYINDFPEVFKKQGFDSLPE